METRKSAEGFRDLNKNGRLDPYEDPRQPIEVRVEDLLGQMSLAEKAGLMFHRHGRRAAVSRQRLGPHRGREHARQ